MKILVNSNLFFLLIYCKALFCQPQIIDAKTKKYIPYVHIVSNSGIILGLSNIKGFINTDKISNKFNIQKTDVVEISHISYRNKKIKWEAILNNKFINLYKNEILLHEVTISAKKSVLDYLVLKGFFRSYQIDNNIPKAYMDGIVEYFIPLFNKNKKLRINLIENRSFRNPLIYDTKIKNKKGTSVTTGDMTGSPYIENRTILNELSTYKLIDSTKTNCKILVNNDTIGALYFDTLFNFIRTDIDVTTPIRSYSRSFLNYTTKFINFSISEHHSNKNRKWNQKSNLLIRTEYRKQLVSHKKVKKAPIQVESFNEFYVIERKYISKSEFKKISTSSFFGSRKTNCFTNFFENIELYSIPKPPYFINKLLGKTLEVY